MRAYRWRLVRRSIAGVLLIALGLALWGSQAPSPDAERQAFGIGLLLLWTAAGVGVLAGRPWARWLSLVVVVAGCLIALRSSTQAGPDGDPLLLDLFFLADGPSFTWFGAAAGSMAFATLAAITGLLLLLPIDVPDGRVRRADLVVLATAALSLLGAVLLIGPVASRLPGYQVTWGIPPGAQEVHVFGTADSVRIDPATIRAGEIYLVFDRSAWGVSFIGGMSDPAETGLPPDLEPLADADVDRIVRGDMFHTATWAGLGRPVLRHRARGAAMPGTSEAQGRSALPASPRAAVALLFEHHYRRLVGLADLVVGDRGVAEEVVQDAFVAVHGRWGRLRDPNAAVAYLNRSVVNGGRSQLRRRRTERAYDPPDAGTAASAELDGLAGSTHRELVDAVRALPRRQREVVVLRYFLDLSEEQIAQWLGGSKGSVKRHAFRATSTLQKRMEAWA
jgi:RNA polymerase sigma-70 factor (sigma-E family)